PVDAAARRRRRDRRGGRRAGRAPRLGLDGLIRPMVVADGARRVAVAGDPDHAGPLASSLDAIGYAVSTAAVAPGDGRVSPGFLATSYGLYRSLRDQPPDAVVFEFRGGHAYCAAAARRLGLAFASCPIVVRCLGSSLPRHTAESLFLSRNQIGAAVTERLAVELADAVVCDEEASTWFDEQGWSLAARRLVRTDDAVAWESVLQDGEGPATPIGKP